MHLRVDHRIHPAGLPSVFSRTRAVWEEQLLARVGYPMDTQETAPRLLGAGFLSLSLPVFFWPTLVSVRRGLKDSSPESEESVRQEKPQRLVICSFFSKLLGHHDLCRSLREDTEASFLWCLGVSGKHERHFQCWDLAVSVSGAAYNDDTCVMCEKDDVWWALRSRVTEGIIRLPAGKAEDILSKPAA